MFVVGRSGRGGLLTAKVRMHEIFLPNKFRLVAGEPSLSFGGKDHTFPGAEEQEIGEALVLVDALEHAPDRFLGLLSGLRYCRNVQ